MSDNTFSLQAEELIDHLSRGLNVAGDEEFFPVMTGHLARLLNADYALVGKLVPGDDARISSLAYVQDGALVDNVSYFLKGSPCEQVLERKTCIYEHGVQQLFPQDKQLAKLGIEGYAGIHLTNALGEPVGIVNVLYRQSIPHLKQTEQLLRIFAGRAGSELDRRRDRADIDSITRELKLQNLRFEALYQLSQMDPDDTQAIKDFALEAAVNITQSSIGYIYLMNDDETVLSLHSWSKSVMAECKVVVPQTEYKVSDTGLWGEAVRQRRPIITNDYLAPNPFKKGLPEGHVPITCHMNLPVFDHNKIVMVAGVSNKQEPYNDEDVRHLTLLMEGLWRALEKNQLITALRESENSFRRFYENSPLSYQSLDSEARYLDVNPAWVETFGYSRDEILGRKFSDIVTAESQALAAQRFSRLKKQGEVNNAAFELIHKDGHSVLVNLHGRSSYDERGIFQHTNCILTDVTQARRAEAQLRESEETTRLLSKQLQTLLDSVPDCILLLDSELRIVWTNQKENNQHKAFANNPKGCFCHTVIHDSSASCPDCPAVQCFKTGEIVQNERTAEDGTVWLRRAFPVFDDDGNVFNVVEIGQDITEKVRLQKDTARTGQLAALGELAAGVAHEINNPIGGVINYAQLLKNRSEPDTQVHNLSERIIKEGDRIARIVKQLLFLSRDDGEDQAIIDFTEILSDSLSLVGRQFNNDGIDISITLAEGLPPIFGHAQQLQQLFLNILSNARYALNQRYPQADPAKQLNVKLDCEESDVGSHLVVSFHDQGTGIPANLLGKVLRPFITSKPASEGTGLGLSLSNDIVKTHGGSLHIESEEGVYTAVTVRFPVHLDNDVHA